MALTRLLANQRTLAAALASPGPAIATQKPSITLLSSSSNPTRLSLSHALSHHLPITTHSTLTTHALNATLILIHNTTTTTTTTIHQPVLIINDSNNINHLNTINNINHLNNNHLNNNNNNHLNNNNINHLNNNNNNHLNNNHLNNNHLNNNNINHLNNNNINHLNTININHLNNNNNNHLNNNHLNTININTQAASAQTLLGYRRQLARLRDTLHRHAHPPPVDPHALHAVRAAIDTELALWTLPFAADVVANKAMAVLEDVFLADLERKLLFRQGQVHELRRAAHAVVDALLVDRALAPFRTEALANAVRRARAEPHGAAADELAARKRLLAGPGGPLMQLQAAASRVLAQTAVLAAAGIGVSLAPLLPLPGLLPGPSGLEAAAFLALAALWIGQGRWKRARARFVCALDTWNASLAAALLADHQRLGRAFRAPVAPDHPEEGEDELVAAVQKRIAAQLAVPKDAPVLLPDPADIDPADVDADAEGGARRPQTLAQLARLVQAQLRHLVKVVQTQDAGGAGHSDAGHSDAGHSDAGHSDAGHSDAGHSDAGHSDSGHSDAGHSNASPSDAGPK
ncbi:hypothetical protein PtA15_12A299 [Puccinia triticina]|uniref:REJ domain-containing protein n=1 Tax=Puccinia triticina TaxID=208348 RepID=A0ABY7CZC3_9BASI|nr:uncharacterized protein PtA15_12A299 [Puccinia triticina]WAQ90310.1 hypothetical protein PtA15_12A299 [Puccinia triticina]